MNKLLTESEIKSIQKILVEELSVKPDQLTPEALLGVDLGADSLSQVEIIMKLEDKFDITIPDEVAEKVKSVKNVYDTVAEMLGRN